MIRNTLIIFFLLTADLIWSQCAMCKAIIEGGDNETMAQGVNNGITYLMIFPYLLVGVLAYFLVRYRKKIRG